MNHTNVKKNTKMDDPINTFQIKLS
jgi:hypothetical protein